MLIKRISLLLFLLPFLFLSTCASKGGGEKTEQFVVNGITVDSNERGREDGYDYELWKNSSASGKMIVGDEGTFSCEWFSGGGGSNILFRTGKRFDNTKPYNKVGNITITYAASRYSPSGISYLSVYGWTQNPLVEYYIVENYYGNSHPGTWGSKKGSFTIEGEGTYNVYTRPMHQQPAIAGPGRYDFTQYISVRTEKRLSGTISVSKHFEEWEKLGLNMSGTLYEAMMKVEGYNSSGKAVLSKNTIEIN